MYFRKSSKFRINKVGDDVSEFRWRVGVHPMTRVRDRDRLLCLGKERGERDNVTVENVVTARAAHNQRRLGEWLDVDQRWPTTKSRHDSLVRQQHNVQRPLVAIIDASQIREKKLTRLLKAHRRYFVTCTLILNL